MTNPMSIIFDGQEIAVKSFDLEISRDMPDEEWQPEGIDYPQATYTAKLTVNPEFDFKFLLRPRRMTITMTSKNQMDGWRHVSPKLEINLGGTRWRIYRRDYRLKKVHLREVLDN